MISIQTLDLMIRSFTNTYKVTVRYAGYYRCDMVNNQTSYEENLYKKTIEPVFLRIQSPFDPLL